MVSLAMWLKKYNFRADQVQAFYPSPMATATAMYHSSKNPLKKVTYDSEKVDIVKSKVQRKLHKALLRYHDPDNWPMIREALQDMKLAHLIGDGPEQKHEGCAQKAHPKRQAVDATHRSATAGKALAGRSDNEHVRPSGLNAKTSGDCSRSYRVIITNRRTAWQHRSAWHRPNSVKPDPRPIRRYTAGCNCSE